MSYKKKSWKEKLNDDKGLPKGSPEKNEEEKQNCRICLEGLNPSIKKLL